MGQNPTKRTLAGDLCIGIGIALVVISTLAGWLACRAVFLRQERELYDQHVARTGEDGPVRTTPAAD